MPRYDYECPDHGEFEASVTFANSDKKQPCPFVLKSYAKGRRVCGKKCKRVARLYAPGINYCDGMTKAAVEIDAANTRKYGHTV